jgi:[acyl-carrier-protein] S-malonyltransferase
MQRAVPVGEGAMAAILGLDFAEVSAIALEAASELYLTGAICEAANDNGGGQVVISGTTAAVERAMSLAKLKGAKRALLLPVSAPFHCTLMRPAAETMAEALREAPLQAPRPPLVANFSASSLDDPSAIRQSLIAQITGTVRWRESVAFMADHGVTRFVEIGAGKVLAGLVKRIAAGATTVSVGAPEDVAAYKNDAAA